MKIAFTERIDQFQKVQQCTIHSLHKDTSFLDNAKPITSDEFIERRDRLAAALHASGADAFVLEPGYTFQYYGNISQTDWEPWEPEERPFLMIVEPFQKSSREIIAKTSFLAPHFEEGRVRMLGIPAREKHLDIIIWEEHWNPYKTLKDKLYPGDDERVVMVDEEMRDYIVRGLSQNGFKTVGLNAEVDAVRQTKTPAEIELLRAVNTGTVEAVRAMRPCLEPGLTEDQVTAILDNAMLSVGFSLFFDIVLFEENAALPHGGFVTGGKVLTYDSMVLIDVGAHYLGYSSDICRSFFIDRPSKRKSLFSHPLHQQKLDVWDIVLRAQAAARKQFKPNNTAASVDIAARDVITDAGYGELFSHRVGHGIGIKAHESPYLNKGNTHTILKAGMTFTDEPGVYITNKFGVRHEDIYLIREDGEAENLSGGEAKGPWEP
ncbi:Creatinase/aminopeptidase [Rhizodiscina lignyota]|uniref:Creatinase/aminopeptidase n=1 Tax=Rhizodiscina lignyota TaxID=1504668 RepID=A0A9P4M3F6_9PEZI|nr:Creatinase/aminopeptidase [Rhizodiscina lignyota]